MKFFMFLIMLLSMGKEVLAHDGHDHGDSAFLDSKTSDVFVLSETQIRNLDLRVSEVQKRTFYETTSMPALIKKPSVLDDTVVVQGYAGEQSDILKIKKGQEVSLVLDAFPNEVFEGKIVRLDTEMNPKTRFFTVVAEVEGVSATLVGFKGVLTVRISEKQESLAVPENALQGTFGDYFVFIKDGEHFTKTPVVIGHKSEGWREIVHGVHLGQNVVTQGSYQLQYVTGTPEEEHNHEKENQQLHIEEAHGHHPIKDEHVHEHGVGECEHEHEHIAEEHYHEHTLDEHMGHEHGEH